MTENEITERLATLDMSCKANSRRIECLEEDNKALRDMAKCLAVLANEQKNMSAKVDEIGKKVGVLEQVPADRWKSLLGYLTAAACSALATLLAAGILGG